MAKYFTEDEFEELENRGMDKEELKKLDDSLLWHSKQIFIEKLRINKEDIFKLMNLKNLLDKKSMEFGVRHSDVLRTIVFSKIYKEEVKANFKIFLRSTLNKIDIVKSERGSSKYYGIFLYDNFLRVYKIDAFFRCTSTKDIFFGDIYGLGRSFKEIDGKTIRYLNLKFKDGELFLYPINKNDEISELYRQFDSFNFKEIEKVKDENSKNKIIGLFLIAFIIFSIFIWK